MTLTIKDPPDSNGPGKQGTPSQNSENKPAQSPRSNPVCLEVGITIRSLPTEAASLTQPIREEGRTVIVFDNGAVLRCKNNLPIGQTVILSNPSGRDVVCRVVAGHNLPSVKGYVEVEFMEAVSDFWSIHHDAAPAAGTAAPQAETPLAPPDLRQTSTAPPPAPPRVAAPIEAPAKPVSAPPAGRPTFSDISSVMDSTPSAAPLEPKNEPARPAPQVAAKSASDYSHSDNSRPTSLANWDSLDSVLSVEKPSSPPRDAWPSTPSKTPSTNPPPRDFMSKGLMAYEKPGSASGSSMGRTPMIVGIAAIVLAAVSGVVFFMHRSSAPVAVAETPSASHPAASNPPSPNNAPAPAAAPQADASPSSARPQLPAQPVSIDQGQAPSALAPVPAVATSPVNADSAGDTLNSRRQEKKSTGDKQAETAASRRPSIPSLKMSSPSAPAKTLADPGQTNAPMTDIAAVGPIGGTPSANLLTSAGRTSNPPAPPPSATAPATVAKTVRDPKLISSVAAVYPPTAKQTNVQGSVTVSASINEVGKVVSATALSGPLLLREAAVDAVKKWKYSPGLVDGKPAPSQATVRVEFRLN